ncbi:MAG: YjgP/YjgQ family permease [Planctomycetes bacterium]|nr:YjgP/YjgQ family permease [Planctomycetota bacterium]
MLTLLDRLLIRSYLKSYLICVVSLISLYVVVDLFTNLEEFTHGRKGMTAIVHDIGIYYGYKVLQVFDQLCEGILLVAAMFTVALVQRNNELMPVLSAGVSTRRMVRPVFVSALLMISLVVGNQEFLLPNVDNYVLENKKDMEGKKEIPVTPAFDDKTLITGNRAVRSLQIVRDFFCIIPDKSGHDSFTRIEAKEAKYVPAGAEAHSGGWMLTGTRPLEFEKGTQPSSLDMIVPGKFFLHCRDVDFETLIRQRNWWMFMSTPNLYGEIFKPGNSRLASLAVMFHMRLTRPVLGMILIVLGLSVILRDQNRNVFISVGLCLLICVLFFLANFFCKHLGDHEYVSPALAAWLPVIIFGPLSFVMFDAIHT